MDLKTEQKVKRLIEELGNQDPEVRRLATGALWNIGNPTLIQILQVGHFRSRLATKATKDAVLGSDKATFALTQAYRKNVLMSVSM